MSSLLTERGFNRLQGIQEHTWTLRHLRRPPLLSPVHSRPCPSSLPRPTPCPSPFLSDHHCLWTLLYTADSQFDSVTSGKFVIIPLPQQDEESLLWLSLHLFICCFLYLGGRVSLCNPDRPTISLSCLSLPSTGDHRWVWLHLTTPHFTYSWPWCFSWEEYSGSLKGAFVFWKAKRSSVVLVAGKCTQWKESSPPPCQEAVELASTAGCMFLEDMMTKDTATE